MWDNGPPNPFLPELVAKWNESELGPIVRYATFDDLLERVSAVPDDDIELQSGDWTDYWSFGLGSAPVATALNRRAKRLLTAASTLSYNGRTRLRRKHWSWSTCSTSTPSALGIRQTIIRRHRRSKR